MEKYHVYMAVKQDYVRWSETPQVYLGSITWKHAVAIAKVQSNEVRLSKSRGFNNQGHYIQPDSYYKNSK